MLSSVSLAQRRGEVAVTIRELVSHPPGTSSHSSACGRLGSPERTEVGDAVEVFSPREKLQGEDKEI